MIIITIALLFLYLLTFQGHFCLFRFLSIHILICFYCCYYYHYYYCFYYHIYEFLNTFSFFVLFQFCFFFLILIKQRLTAQKMKFSIKEFFSKCDQIRRKLWIWSHLLQKSLMENFIFCAVVCSHMKRLRLVNCLDFLYVCFVLLLELKWQDHNSQHHCFSLTSFIYCSFNIQILSHFEFSYFYCHWFYYQFILTDFMTVTSEQNVFVIPQLDSFLPKFIDSGLELC